MDNLNEEIDKINYNEDVVYYCRDCLSLRIEFISLLEDSEYCDKCGSTDIATASIEEWEAMYIEKYGHKYLEE